MAETTIGVAWYALILEHATAMQLLVDYKVGAHPLE